MYIAADVLYAVSPFVSAFLFDFVTSAKLAKTAVWMVANKFVEIF